jgi:tetratricopeptide (TPR) repeat protein
MTRTDGLRSPRGIVTAALLIVAGVLLAALCFRVAIVEVLPSDAPAIARFAPNDPEVVLDKAATALVAQHGILDPATLAAVRSAAAAAPLDARAFLVLGHQDLLDRKPDQAVATLEAGQRLDPRDRVIHLLLLDRYLRTGRYADAATQFSVSARLIGAADSAIASAMAQMSLAPGTRDAVRRTLRTDPRLEEQVLIALAKSQAAPATIFALASPTALREAGDAESWGPALVDRLVAQGRYAEAREIWQRIYRLPDAAVATPLFDAGLHKLPGTPPFNWTLVASGLGGADMRSGTLAIDYYGRDTGLLAEQLLVLKPGAYRFTFAVEGSKVAAGPTLAWTLRCAAPKGDSGPELMNAVVAATGMPHRETAGFTVPANCPAQRLALSGNAGEFPTPMSVTLRDLALQAAEHP